jgi:hypothetical protein
MSIRCFGNSSPSSQVVDGTTIAGFAKLLAVLLINLAIPRAYAQTGAAGKLFGYIDNSAAGQTSSFVSIDLNTAQVTVVGTVPSPGLQVFGSALDPATHRYFLVGCVLTPGVGLFPCSTEALLVLNPQTGAASPVVPVTPVETIMGNLFPQFDPSGGNLFEYINPASPGGPRSIDPTSGAEATGLTVPLPGLVASGSAIDPATHRYFLVGCVPGISTASCSTGAALLIVNTETSTAGSVTPIATPTGNLFPQFDPDSGKLLGYIDNSAAGQTSTFVSIDPTTAAVSTVGTVPPPGLEVFGSAIDPATHRYFLVGCVPDLTTPQPFSCSPGGALLILNTQTGMPGSLTPLATPTGNLFLQFEPTALPPAPGFLMTPTILEFGSQMRGTTSAAKTLSISNLGDAVLAISSISVAGTNAADFQIAPSTACPLSGGNIAPGSNCLLNVTFSPTVLGFSGAAISIADNAAGNPHFAALGGVGLDLEISGTTTATVAAGQTAHLNMQVGLSFGFAGSVSLACSSTTTTIICSVPPTLQVGSVDGSGPPSTSFTVSAATTARSVSALTARRNGPPSGIVFRIVGIALIQPVILVLAYLRWMRWRSAYFLTAVLFCMALSSCSSKQPTSVQTGTPPGTYTLTLAAASGGARRTLPLTLNVQ